MTDRDTWITGGPVFDGHSIADGDPAAVFVAGIFDRVEPMGQAPERARRIDLNGHILSPGFVDLQVNGGGGVMLNDAPTPETVARIAAAHHALGVRALLPTLITDTPEVTRDAIAAVAQTVARGNTPVIGLHLEGPHLSVTRKGAHDAQYIRAMEDADLEALLAAKRDLPVLKVTVAPESVRLEQVTELVDAGIIVSLGHSDADFDTCMAFADAGASCATHLFNAMSQLGNRQPGLVGAALSHPQLSAGLIADAIHVHPANMALAWGAKGARGQIYLVSDAMAVAGTELDAFHLDGRRILRRDGQLRLADGTLAGADLNLLTALRVLVGQVAGVTLPGALAAATGIPGAVVGTRRGRLVPGETRLSDMIAISPDLTALRALA